MPYVVTTDCNLCGACIAGCQTGALQEGETQAVIDSTICIACGTCAANCPFQAIAFEPDEDQG